MNSFNQFINDPNNTKQGILDEIFNGAEIKEQQITSDCETTRGSRKEIGSGKRRNGKDNGKSNGKPCDLASYLLVCSMIAFSLSMLTILSLSHNKYVSYGLVFAIFMGNLRIQWLWSNVINNIITTISGSGGGTRQMEISYTLTISINVIGKWIESHEIQQSSTMNLCPFGIEQETENQVFNNGGVFLNAVFSYAKLLYIQACIRTETPLAELPLANANDYSTEDYYQGLY